MKTMLLMGVFFCCAGGGCFLSLRYYRRMQRIGEIRRMTERFVRALAERGASLAGFLEEQSSQSGVGGLWAQNLLRELRTHPGQPQWEGLWEEKAFSVLTEAEKRLLVPPVWSEDPTSAYRQWQRAWSELAEKAESDWKRRGVLAARLGVLLGLGMALLLL